MTHHAEVKHVDQYRFGYCYTCEDRGPLTEEADKAQEWVDDHVHRSRFGNMLQPHTNWKRETAARIYRERSADPRWSEEHRLLWAQMADELEYSPDEGQDTLF